jgi:arylsulfatase A-like enzyme
VSSETRPAARTRALPTVRLATICTVLAAYFLAFMEWLFFATKPSFLSPLGFAPQVASYFGAAALIAVPASLLAGAIGGVARLGGSARGFGTGLVVAVPAVLTTACLLLLIDNFTYTVFDFGVLLTGSTTHWLYALLFAALFATSVRRFTRLRVSATSERRLGIAATSLLLVSALTTTTQYLASSDAREQVATIDAGPDRLPNILLLASDGIEASHMSAYGAKRDTTPFIAKWMDRALVAENAFPNATATAGSVVAMLTSKLPTHTRLYQYQNILTGLDAYQHLPGLLRDIGYRSMHVSVLLFADPSALPKPWNMQNAFDDFESVGSLPPGAAVAWSTNVYFFGQMLDRVLERLRHSIGRGRKHRKGAEILSAAGTTDAQRIDAVLGVIENSERPVFAHLHLMDTHEPYRPSEAFFSGGEGARQRRNDDYDSAIRTFDGHVEDIFARLRRAGKLDDTIVVLSSDHGRDWSFGRVPLMFFFPGGAHRGVIRTNVALIDVAPTLLDYLGLPIPEWMEGQSLIAGAPDAMRPIESVRVVTDAGPPFPQMGRIGLTTCDRTVWVMPRAARSREEPVPGHTAPCDPDAQPDPAQLRAMIVSDLARNGYDVSRLRALQGPRHGGKRAARPMIRRTNRGR